jgi:hypothetical protein
LLTSLETLEVEINSHLGGILTSLFREESGSRGKRMAILLGVIPLSSFYTRGLGVLNKPIHSLLPLDLGYKLFDVRFVVIEGLLCLEIMSLPEPLPGFIVG